MTIFKQPVTYTAVPVTNTADQSCVQLAALHLPVALHYSDQQLAADVLDYSSCEAAIGVLSSGLSSSKDSSITLMQVQ